MRSPNWTTEELILAADLADRNEWKGVNGNHEGVRELSVFLRSAEIHPGAATDPAFRSANSVGMKVNNLRASHPSHSGKGLRVSKSEIQIVQEFVESRDLMKAAAQQIRAYHDASYPVLEDQTPPDTEVVEAAIEGGARYITSLRRERDPKLRRAKIQAHTQDGKELACEICDFNFLNAYGKRGEGYIEVHHRTPLHHSGSVISEISDLILLCANCHRIIHRGSWITPEELSNLMSSIRNC